MRICAMTCCTVDLYPQVGCSFVGGNAVNIAVQARKSGTTHVSVIGVVGQDHYGDAVKRKLQLHHIDASHIHQVTGVTASNRIYVDDTGSRCFLPDSWDGGVYAEFRLSDEDWAFANTHNLVSMVTVDSNFVTALKKMHTPVLLTADFLDTRNMGFLEEHLDRIDIAFFSGDDDLVEQAKAVARARTAFIVITLGARGSVALRHDQVFYQTAQMVKAVRDTTGCGDAYQAAFICSWYKHYNIEQALQAGSEAAAQVLTHYGGFEECQIQAPQLDEPL